MIRCRSCQLAACTCGKEDWEEYQTGGEAKVELARLKLELEATKKEVVKWKKAHKSVVHQLKILRSLIH